LMKKTLVLVILLTVVTTLLAGEQHSQPARAAVHSESAAGGWSIRYGPNTQPNSSQFEEYICTRDSSGGGQGTPPAKLISWDVGRQAERISLAPTRVLAANPGCPTTSPSWIDAQLDSIAPISMTVPLYNAGSYRVMAPGRTATWTGLQLDPSLLLTSTTAGVQWGFQTSEPDVIRPDGSIDKSGYRVFAATFALANDPNDPFTFQVVNGPGPLRPFAAVADYATGTTWFALLDPSKYPPAFFTTPHDYQIVWSRVFSSDPNKPLFCLLFKVDSQVAATYVNGQSGLSLFAINAILTGLQVGAASAVNDIRWIKVRPAQMFAANTNSPSTDVGNGPFPTTSQDIWLKGMSIVPN